MKAVSLFSGVGGFDRALELCGHEVVASVEIDKQARGVIAQHFPNTKLFEDVKSVTGEQLRDAGFVSNGIITGGFPCQDLSIAGKRRGLAGERSGLFFEIIRLAEETQAEWLVLENVPGLLSSKRGRDMGIVLGALVDIGYGVAYRVLDSQFFGVPQRRRRVYIVARRAGDWESCVEVLFKRESVRGDSTTERGEGRSVTAGTVVGTLSSRTGRSTGAQDAGGGHLVAFSHTQGLDIQPSTEAFPTLRANGGGHAITHTLTANWDASEDESGRGLPLVPVYDISHRADVIRESHGSTPTLTSRMGTGGHNVPLVQPYVKVIRSGARDADGNLPPEVWREEVTAPTLNQFDQSGEARTPVLLTMREGKDGGGKGPLISEDKSLTLATGNNQTLFHRGVRRLTPIETERLQNFPDNWTEFSDGKPQSDSHRYKQMGNAATVSVAQWVIQGITDKEEAQ